MAPGNATPERDVSEAPEKIHAQTAQRVLLTMPGDVRCAAAGLLPLACTQKDDLDALRA